MNLTKNSVMAITYNITHETMEGIKWFSIAKSVKYNAFSKPKETINYGPFASLALAEEKVAELKAKDQAFVEDWLKNNN